MYVRIGVGIVGPEDGENYLELEAKTDRHHTTHTHCNGKYIVLTNSAEEGPKHKKTREAENIEFIA